MYKCSEFISSNKLPLADKARPRRTNKNRIKSVQKLELVRLMKANFLFIRGKHTVVRSEKSRAEVWNAIAARLNSLGSPKHSAMVWQKRWNDMRSATNRKMVKIQNYVSEDGEECPYQLNLVERLIWDTFEVRPEEYMNDLNMKLWREKQQQMCGRYSASSCSSQMSKDQSIELRWNHVATTCHDTDADWNYSVCNDNGVTDNCNPLHHSLDCGYSHDSEGYLNNNTHQRNMGPTNQWTSAGGPSPEFALPEAKIDTFLENGNAKTVLQNFDMKLDLIQQQNDRIASILQSTF